MLTAYRTISFQAQIPGASGSYSTHIGAVAKSNQNVPYCIPNEIICAKIARFLGLPVPPMGVIYAPNAPTPYWCASLDFNLTGTSLPPVDPVACVSQFPDLSSGLVLFDILVGNSDRHSGNFAVDTSATPPQLNIFDQGHALFGSQANGGKQRLTDLRDRLGISGGSQTQGNRHCLLDKIPNDDNFQKWFDRIDLIPDFMIEDVCDGVIGLGIDQVECETAIDFLKHRRDSLKVIVGNNKPEFTGITDWKIL